MTPAEAMTDIKPTHYDYSAGSQLDSVANGVDTSICQV